MTLTRVRRQGPPHGLTSARRLRPFDILFVVKSPNLRLLVICTIPKLTAPVLRKSVLFLGGEETGNGHDVPIVNSRRLPPRNLRRGAYPDEPCDPSLPRFDPKIRAVSRRPRRPEHAWRPAVCWSLQGLTPPRVFRREPETSGFRKKLSVPRRGRNIRQGLRMIVAIPVSICQEEDVDSPGVSVTFVGIVFVHYEKRRNRHKWDIDLLF